MTGLPATDPNAPCEFLTWDSAHFGLRIARAATNRLTAGQAAEILNWCGRHAIDCLYFLSDPDPESTAAAENHGFHLTDVRLTFEIPLDSGRVGPGRRPVSGRPRGAMWRRSAPSPASAIPTPASIRMATSRELPATNCIVSGSRTVARTAPAWFWSPTTKDGRRVMLHVMCAATADGLAWSRFRIRPRELAWGAPSSPAPSGGCGHASWLLPAS